MQPNIDVPYVVATAEIAQRMNEVSPHGIQSINQLIEDGAERNPDCKVVGMVHPTGDGWRYFRDLFRISIRLANFYEKAHNLPARTTADGGKEMNVAILAASSLDFLTSWLALLRLGFGVLFIAPQCSAQAAAHLLEVTKATHLFHDEKYKELATNANEELKQHSIQTCSIATGDVWRPFLQQETKISPRKLDPSIEADTTAVIFHTSGSSGMPKPIYGTHRVWTKALPRKADRPAFTTTPLYHGGTADLMRAMMSDSLLYLFTSEKPVTASNVVASIHAAQDVAYFLSVPYILKLLSEDKPASKLLAEMKMISVGGAPLPDELGDFMVSKLGWNLVSRMGSSEAGFLMSSWRDFSKDKEWTFLRQDGNLISFESKGDNLAELVVSSLWPTLNAHNRENGNFATGDLYQAHPTTPRAWRYHGRADDILVLSNGEKVPAASIESILRADKHIQEVIVFGSDRPNTSAVIFPSSEFASLSVSDFLQQISVSLQKANSNSPTFARLSREMIIIERDISQLPRSSKGTVQKGLATALYKERVDRLYGDDPTESSAKATRPKEKESLRKIVRTGIESVLDRPAGNIHDTTDLFAFGVDSLHAARIRKVLLTSLSLESLPSNVVFEHPSVEEWLDGIPLESAKWCKSGCQAVLERAYDKLSRQVFKFHKVAGESADCVKAGMHCRLLKYICRNLIKQLLTGATGALGAHLLAQLLQRHPETPVICLCRASNNDQAKERVRKSLKARKVDCNLDKVECMAADLSRPDLGLTPSHFGLVRGCSRFIHAAWPVNFSMHLSSFSESLQGLHNLLQIALKSPSQETHFTFCSSIASVLGSSSPRTILEKVSITPSDCGPIGYSQSKWVAEKICANASESGLSTSIARIGQLCGDTQHGVWNTTEAWPLMIQTATTFGCLPLIQEDLSWLAVDTAAATILDLCENSKESLKVCHVCQPGNGDRWPEFLVWLKQSGLEFETVQPQVWLGQLENYAKQNPDDAASHLISLWNDAYSQQLNFRSLDASVDNTNRLSPSFRLRHAVDQGLVTKMVRQWQESGFLKMQNSV